MRKVKGFLIFLLLLLVIAGGGLVFMRVGRSRSSEATVVKPNLVSVSTGAKVYVFAAKVGSRAILFDTGLDPEAHPVDSALASLGKSRGDVTDLFLTHAHPDHVGGASQFPKAKLHLGAGDVALAEGKVGPDMLIGRVLNLALPVPPVSVSDPLTAAASFDLGEGKAVKAYPVPGHTPGSYAFLYDAVLFVGDIMVFKQGQLELPPSMFDARPDENKAAIRSLKTQLGSETVEIVCTAHGGCTPKGLGHSLLEELISRV